jgi:hypothetical protein
MTFDVGDYVIHTPEKRQKLYESELYLTSYTGLNATLAGYEDTINYIKKKRVGVFIVTKIMKNKKIFEATLDGELLKKLSIKDFEKTTLEEKRSYQLKKVFNK